MEADIHAVVQERVVQGTLSMPLKLGLMAADCSPGSRVAQVEN